MSTTSKLWLVLYSDLKISRISLDASNSGTYAADPAELNVYQYLKVDRWSLPNVGYVLLSEQSSGVKSCGKSPLKKIK